MSSQIKSYTSDTNGDGLIDGSTKIQLATGEGPLNVRTWKGKSVPTTAKRWEAEKATLESTGFKVLLKGTGGRQGKYKVLEVNTLGVINRASKWQSISKALRNGWESDFGDVIKNDGVIGRNSESDANSDGLFDRRQLEAYRIVTNSNELLTLRSQSGEKLSSSSSKRWDAVQALEVEDGFQVLLHKGSEKKNEFKLLYVNEKGITTKQTKWMQSVEALNASWDIRLRDTLLAIVSSDGGLQAASVDGEGAAGQLIYKASASDASAVTYALRPLEDRPLTGLSIDANSGEVRLLADALIPLPESIGFSVVATDLAGNSTSLDIVVSLSLKIVEVGEPSTDEAGISALSVETSISEEGVDGEDSTDTVDVDGEDSTDIVDADGAELVSSEGNDLNPTLVVSVESEVGGLTNDNMPEFSGTASAGATVEIFADEELLGSTTADGEGGWAFTVAENAGLVDGSYLFTARELKPDGNDPSGSEPTTLTIDRTVPVFTSSSNTDVTIELTPAQVDADLNGLVDGSNGTKIFDKDKIVQITNRSGQIFEGSRELPMWGFDIDRAIRNLDQEEEGYYRLLLSGTGSANQDLFGEWRTNSSGRVLDKKIRWISKDQALVKGWEEVYGDVIEPDGIITKAPIEDFSNTSGIYFVAKDGDDTNSGTIDDPFASIQHAIGRLKPGDILNIREGEYKEHLRINNLDGTTDQRITIQSYGDEEVVVSGAREIASEWVPYKGNIWKTKVDFDVTQLFLDDTMLTGARWPNISKDWHELDDSDGSKPTPGSYWDLNTRAHTTPNVSPHNVSDLGFSVEGAVAVNYFNNAVDVIQHNADESSLQVDGRLSGHYYLTQHLDLLDQPKEWHYEEDTGELYVWLEGDANPNDQVIEARGYDEGETSKLASTNTPSTSIGSKKVDISSWGTPDKILQMQRSSFIDFKDITFRVGAFDLWGDHDITFEDTKFFYSAHPRFMLSSGKRMIPAHPYRNPYTNSAGGGGRVKGLEVNVNSSSNASGNRFHNANMKWINNEFAYNFGSPDLDLGANANNYLIENTYFHNNPGNGGFASFRVLDGMVARRNTVHSMGFGGMSRLGTKFAQRGGKSLAELNRIYDYHFDGDDAGIQINTGHTIGTTLRHNWIHDMPGRNGIRFDGDPGGIGGTAHSNVSFNNRRGYRFKGDQHTLISNLAFDNEKYDFGVDQDKFYGYLTGYDPATQGLIRPQSGINVYTYRDQGRRGSKEAKGNLHSIVHNNTGDIERVSIPVLNPANKTGNSMTMSERGHSIKDELRDPANFDFRPRLGSSLIDSGIHKPGITDGFIGAAPDIGPYEYGDDYYWIPGHKTEYAKSPIPINGSKSAKPNTDLIWLEGLEMNTNNIYLGTDPANLEFQTTQISNIFVPQQSLIPGQIYYWRVDTVTDNGVVPGEIWNFTVGASASPTDLSLSSLEVSTDAVKDDVLATVSTIDADLDDFHTYELVEGNGDISNSLFQIKNNSLLASGVGQFSADQKNQIRISSTDSFGNTLEKEFILTTISSQPGIEIEPITEPISDPETDTTAESVTDEIAEPITEPISDPETDTTTESVTDEIVEPITEPISDPETDTTAESVTDEIVEPITEPVTETTPTPLTQPIEIVGTGSYGKKNADQIINFDPASQRLEINTQSFGVQSDALFATINSKRVKRSAKTDNDFIYNQRTGRLYFNQNGSDKRWGDGGMFAVLIGKPELTSEIVDLI